MRRLTRAAALVGTTSVFALRAWSAPSAPRTPPFSSVPTVRPRVVATHPHDPAAFTQGLVSHGGELIESTGMYGQSTLRAVDPATGRVRTRTFLAPQYFGEGVTILGDSIYLLTWREHVAFVYSLDFLVQKRFTFDGEGWGLTNDGTHLIMSDGTSTLRFLDPATFQVVRTLKVHEAGADVPELNELEMVRGQIWANVWHTNRIVRIAPDSGDVVGVLDLSALDGGWSAADSDAVLNGIAYDEAHDKIYVTGKLWPKLFEISVPRGAAAR